MVDSILQDLRLAVRSLAKSPGFTTVIVLTLVLGIGANTAIFSVVDTVLMNPLGYPDADELVVIVIDRPDARRGRMGYSDAGYRHFLEKNRTFAHFGAYRWTDVPLTGRGDPVRIRMTLTTNSAFDALGVDPLLGRLPTAEEDVAGGPLVAVLSHALWVSRFGADPGVLGGTVELNDRTREVVGVMPPGFQFPDDETELWIPLQLDPAGTAIGLIRYCCSCAPRGGCVRTPCAPRSEPRGVGSSGTCSPRVCSSRSLEAPPGWCWPTRGSASSSRSGRRASRGWERAA